jgi:cytochrome c5
VFTSKLLDDMLKKTKYIALACLSAALVSACGTGADGDDQGLEYAPQMYHSVAYEPLTQITDTTGNSKFWVLYHSNTNPYNDYKGKTPINMRQPVEGTVKRQNFTSVTKSPFGAEDQQLFFYELHKDSIDLAARVLKNPVPLDSTGVVLEEGKQLYLSYCSPCHGEKGAGDGKVGAMYKGVPNYATGRYATLAEGHIFHTITHGKGRMWSHKSQISPEDRWKIVHYVQVLQKGQ